MTTLTRKPADMSWLTMNPGTTHPAQVEFAAKALRDGEEVNLHVCGALWIMQQLAALGINCEAFVTCNERGDHGNGVTLVAVPQTTTPMLIIFDKDGTLVGAANRPANTPEEQVLLPNRIRTIRKLRSTGKYAFAIASNQGGIELGYITDEQADALMIDVATKIGGVDAWMYCRHYKTECTCRKPKPGMLLELMARLDYTPEMTVFVGDQDSDRHTAEAAGCVYMSADEFFKDVL